MNTPSRQVARQMKLTVNFRKEGRQVIAYAPALDISTVGKDEKHARKRFEELVSVFFDDLIERNVLGDVLSELGWKQTGRSINNKQQQSWSPPEISQKEISVSVPALV